MLNKIKWSNAKKTKPKCYETVLVCCGGSLTEASYDGEKWFTGSKNYHVSAITHWAKINKPRLPKPKKVEFKQGKAPLLMPSFESFKSPLDGSVITCPSKLRSHNKKHGVTNIKDYAPGHFEKRGKEMELEARGQTPQAELERKKLIDKTLNDFGV